MSYLLNETVKGPSRGWEVMTYRRECFSDTLADEVRILAGIELTSRETDLAIRFHTVLRF